MSYEKSVSDHYIHGSLLQAIEAALLAMGTTKDKVTLDDLAAIDEFHIGGRMATDHLLEQLNFAPDSQVLDIGCGLGGAARHVASRYHCSVTGIDLSQEYIDTGTALCQWLGLDEQVKLHCASALTLPFPDNSFDGAYMLHVGMNIKDKAALFSEISRVLKPEAMLGIYDVMRLQEGVLAYPVPWAADNATSQLATLEQYVDWLAHACFNLTAQTCRHGFALDFFEQVRNANKKRGAQPALSLHTLMGDNAALKLSNMVNNVSLGLVAPVEVIVQKD